MKEFRIIATPDRNSGNYIVGVELADNLRDAWYFFKKSYKQYDRLFFHSATCGDKYYPKLY